MSPTLFRWIAYAVLALFLVGAYKNWENRQIAKGDKQGAARVTSQWDQDIKRRDAEKLAAVTQARKEEKETAANAAKGERDALQKAAAKAASDLAAARRAAAAAGRLSSHIAEIDGAARAIGMPSAAACPAEFAKQRDAAVRARELFGSCVARYRDLGQGADDAWRAVTLKLDTALSYIQAVAPAQP